VLVSVKAVTTLNERLVLSFLSSMIGEKREKEGKGELRQQWGQTKQRERKEEREDLNDQIWRTIQEIAASSPNFFILLLVGHSLSQIPWVEKFLLNPADGSQRIGVVLTEDRYGLDGLLGVGKCLQDSERLVSHWLEPPQAQDESRKRKREREEEAGEKKKKSEG